MSRKSNIQPRRRLLNLAVLAALGGGALAPPSASAADLYWACGSAAWDANCWSTASGGAPAPGQPQNGDNVFLTSGASPLTVDYANPATSLNQLTIGNADWIGGMTLSQTVGSLAANVEQIGFNGASGFNPTIGTHNQSGGTNTVGSLNMGSNGIGTYDLSGGSLATSNTFMGSLGFGEGRFNQTGGTHTTGYMGVLGGGSSYNLSAGSLSVSGVQNLVGGAFNQSGGTNETGSISVGIGGYFTLTAGSLTTTGSATIDGGDFVQTGGTHVISGDLDIGGYNSDYANYNLSGTGNLSATNEMLGGMFCGYNCNGGSAYFTQSGGTNTVTSNLILGQYAGSSGIYTLDGGTLNVGNIIYGSGRGTFNYNGGTLNITGNQVALNTFVSNSNFTLTSGQTLTAAEGITNNANGSFTVGADATVAAGGLGLVNYGLLGGTGTVVGNVISSGNVGPGNSPGMLSITGDYTQSATGTFTAEIGGLLAGRYDVLNVSGTAFLDGLLNVSLYDLGGGMFRPHAGDYFDIITASLLQGSFSSLSFAALSDPNLFWRVDYITDAIGTTDVVRLSIGQNAAPVPVPEPETYAMLLAGLGLLGFAGRRRKVLGNA